MVSTTTKVLHFSVDNKSFWCYTIVIVTKQEFKVLGYYDYDIHDVVNAVCATVILFALVVVPFVFTFGV